MRRLRALAVTAVVAVTSVAHIVAPSVALAKPAASASGTSSGNNGNDRDDKLEKIEDTVAGGTHWRIKTKAGAVHVWIPGEYDRATAGTVVYVHGYHTNSDGAWRNYGLAKQFRTSKQNAMFVVPDAPSGNDEEVKWPALTDLRKAVARANIRLPDGPLVVVGHSGAFRTVMKWIDNRTVNQIILLDALYGGEKAFDEYIDRGKRADDHKLIVVGAATAQGSKSFAKKYPFAVTRDKLPSSAAGFKKREKQAKLLYVRSQYDHMSIVTNGKVIPTLLHLTQLKALDRSAQPRPSSARTCGLSDVLACVKR
ncbi:MAG: hypothetical protein KBG15_19795 [Kofleriaceae bacterium]|nr:hypothetical protein [Kofleriaceae bacterium]